MGREASSVDILKRNVAAHAPALPLEGPCVGAAPGTESPALAATQEGVDFTPSR